MVLRLELLGYNLEHCRELYDDLARAIPDDYPEPEVTFDQFKKTLYRVNVGQVQLPEAGDDYDLGEFVLQNVLKDPEFAKHLPQAKHFTRDEATFFENVDPYLVLRLLAENKRNLNKDVVWHYSDVVEGGWVNEEDLYEGLSDSDRYLVVTEGSSDSSILKKSLDLLFPDIADFFTFIDMSENYPFTGTGNLYRFCQGLARIKIQNKVLVVFDNDTAGNEAYEKVKALRLPRNMRITLLPELQEFKSFPTRGPSGQSRENINGKAVSIELFLDLTSGPVKTPEIRWTSYHERLDRYQGELVDKENVVRDFLHRRSLGPEYDVSKLKRLWEHLIQRCTASPDARRGQP